MKKDTNTKAITLGDYYNIFYNYSYDDLLNPHNKKKAENKAVAIGSHQDETTKDEQKQPPYYVVNPDMHKKQAHKSALTFLAPVYTFYKNEGLVTSEAAYENLQTLLNDQKEVDAVLQQTLSKTVVTQINRYIKKTCSENKNSLFANVVLPKYEKQPKA